MRQTQNKTTNMTDLIKQMKSKADQREEFNSQLELLGLNPVWMDNDNIYEVEFTKGNKEYKFFQSCFLNYSQVTVDGYPASNSFNNFSQVIIQIKKILN